jgi:hypothetical protein
MNIRVLQPSQPITVGGERASYEMLEIMQRLVAEVQALRADLAALEVRVTALEP